MNPIDAFAALVLVAILMLASTKCWRNCMDENNTNAVWHEKWDVNIGEFGIYESKNATKFWAEFSTIIAVVLIALLIWGEMGLFIQGNGWKVIALVLGATIISTLPYYLAKVGYKKGR